MEKTYTMPMSVLYRGMEGQYMICDITSQKETGVKIKLDNSNSKLLEKINQIPRRRTVWITYQTIGIDYKTEGTKIMQVLTKDEYMERYIPYQKKEKEMEKRRKEVYLNNLRKRRR